MKKKKKKRSGNCCSRVSRLLIAAQCAGASHRRAISPPSLLPDASRATPSWAGASSRRPPEKKISHCVAALRARSIMSAARVARVSLRRRERAQRSRGGPWKAPQRRETRRKGKYRRLHACTPTLAALLTLSLCALSAVGEAGGNGACAADAGHVQAHAERGTGAKEEEARKREPAEESSSSPSPSASTIRKRESVLPSHQCKASCRARPAPLCTAREIAHQKRPPSAFVARFPELTLPPPPLASCSK